MTAQDAESTSLAYELDEAPAGMAMDAKGRIQWQPSLGDVGVHAVTVTVSDGLGGAVSQSYELEVLASQPNHDPRIVSTPREQIGLGRTYLYQVAAVDDDGDPLAYEVTTGPAGMTIGADGLAQWQPTPEQFGAHTVELTVRDGRGTPAEQSFTVEVVSSTDNVPPQVDSLCRPWPQWATSMPTTSRPMIRTAIRCSSRWLIVPRACRSTPGGYGPLGASSRPTRTGRCRRERG